MQECNSHHSFIAYLESADDVVGEPAGKEIFFFDGRPARRRGMTALPLLPRSLTLALVYPLADDPTT
jgi:hypothetical protein